jgi:hypothetical protein
MIEREGDNIYLRSVFQLREKISDRPEGGAGNFFGTFPLRKTGKAKALSGGFSGLPVPDTCLQLKRKTTALRTFLP